MFRVILNWLTENLVLGVFVATSLVPLPAFGADLLMFPDLPPGNLYPSAPGDPNLAYITPILGHPEGAYSGNDYYFVKTGSIQNGGHAFGGIVFNMPTSFLSMPVPQRYKLEIGLQAEDLSEFEVRIANQDGGGQLNALTHTARVGPDWVLDTWYATLDGENLNGHANIPRSQLYIYTDPTYGGPNRPFLIDHLMLSPIVTGDFDEDHDTDCADVDALVSEIVAGSHQQQFDLTGDGTVDHDDLDHWRSAAGEIRFGDGKIVLEGDANLDGIVDGLDFITWNQHKFTATAAWCAGDFNADGIVDGQDFVLWNQHKFQSSDATTLVPEPSGLLWLGLMGAVCLWKQRRRHA